MERTRYRIKGHPAPGFKGVFRAGRDWPAAGMDVDVVPGKTDPALFAGTPVISEATLEVLRADARITVTLAGEENELVMLRKKVNELRAAVADRDAQIAALSAAPPVASPAPDVEMAPVVEESAPDGGKRRRGR